MRVIDSTSIRVYAIPPDSVISNVILFGGCITFNSSWIKGKKEKNTTMQRKTKIKIQALIMNCSSLHSKSEGNHKPLPANIITAIIHHHHHRTSSSPSSISARGPSSGIRSCCRIRTSTSFGIDGSKLFGELCRIPTSIIVITNARCSSR